MRVLRFSGFLEIKSRKPNKVSQKKSKRNLEMNRFNNQNLAVSRTVKSTSEWHLPMKDQWILLCDQQKHLFNYFMGTRNQFTLNEY